MPCHNGNAIMDQSCNAIIYSCNINIIKSCFSTPEQQQLQLFLLSIHHRHLYTHSTISTVLAQDSRADRGYQFYAEVTIYVHTMVQIISHILTVSSVDDKTSDRLSYLT